MAGTSRMLVVPAAAALLLAPGDISLAAPPPPSPAWTPPVVIDVTAVSTSLTSPTTDPSGDQARAPADTEPPSSPGTPEASVHSPFSLTLSWAPSTDNVDVVAYDIFSTRFDGSERRVARVVVIDNDVPAWRFERLLPDYDYQFHVVALDASGNRSAPSDVLRLRTPADPGSVCEMAHTVTSVGAGQVEGVMVLSYTGSAAEVWVLRFSLPGGQELQLGPLPGWVQHGTEVVAWHEGWADGLFPGERVLYYWATGAVSDPPPTDYSVNGQACTVR